MISTTHFLQLLFAALASLQMVSGFAAKPPIPHTTRALASQQLAMGGASVLEREEVATRVPAIQERPKERIISRPHEEGSESWEVRIYNDGENTREWVTQVLVKVSGISELAAYQTMMRAQQDGSAAVGQWVLEVAELYQCEIQQHGIACKLLPVEEADWQ